MKELLLDYANYNFWANEKILAALEKVDPKLIDKEVKGCFKSLRKTIYNIWNAETLWFSRLANEKFEGWPSEIFKGNFSELKQLVLAQSLKFKTYVMNRDPEQLAAPVSYIDNEGIKFTLQAFRIFMHCMNHSNFHRGQIVTTSRNLGIKQIPYTDYISYTLETTNANAG